KYARFTRLAGKTSASVTNAPATKVRKKTLASDADLRTRSTTPRSRPSRGSKLMDKPRSGVQEDAEAERPPEDGALEHPVAEHHVGGVRATTLDEEDLQIPHDTRGHERRRVEEVVAVHACGYALIRGVDDVRHQQGA